jgi:MYXO-CTERM domain-containing protein
MEFQMRNKTFISSMVGVAAAVAVAGSANAGVVDPFTTAQALSTSPGVLPISGALFDERGGILIGGSASGSIDGSGNFNFTVTSGSYNTVILEYQMNGGATNDLSSIAAMSIALSGLNTSGAATGIAFVFSLADENDNYLYSNEALLANGVSTFNFASAFVDDGFDLTKVKLMTLSIGYVGTPGAGSSSGTLSNFSYTAVPAPGALALLGAAGLVGARRRRA